MILICNSLIFQHISPRNVLILCFRTVNVSVPKKTRNNGTLYAYIFLHHAGVLPWHDGKQVHIVSPLTTYMVPKPEEINLLTGESTTQVGGFSIYRKIWGKKSMGRKGETKMPFCLIISCYTNSRPFSTANGEPSVIVATIKTLP